MKYSIIMSYFMRDVHLYNTLISFNYHYKNRNDYEVIIIEDIKNKNNKEEHDKLLKVLKFFNKNADKYIDIKLIESGGNYSNPATLFNQGAKLANGDYLIITNPEVFHKENILKGLDSIIKEKGECYIVCSCLSGDIENKFIDDFESFNITPKMWYQHSQYRNALFHFCSCISKKKYFEIGGFDERYKNGVAYDDDQFRDDVGRSGILFVISDNLLTIHQNHENAFKYFDFDKRLKRNKTLYSMIKQNKTNEEIDSFLKGIDG